MLLTPAAGGQRPPSFELLELRPRRNGPSCGGLLLSVHEAEQHGRYHGSDDCCRDVTQEVAHRHILLSEGVPVARVAQGKLGRKAAFGEQHDAI